MFKPIWIIIAKWATIIGGILLVLFKVRQSGKEAIINQDIKETLKGVQTRDKIENTVVAADIVERKRLRDKWTK